MNTKEKSGMIDENFMIYKREYLLYEGLLRYKKFLQSEYVDDNYKMVLPFFEMKTKYFNPHSSKKIIIVEQLEDGTPTI